MTAAAAQEKKLITSGGTPTPVNRFFAYIAPEPVAEAAPSTASAPRNSPRSRTVSTPEQERRRRAKPIARPMRAAAVHLLARVEERREQRDEQRPRRDQDARSGRS